MMKITWYDQLYVGEKARKKRYPMIRALRSSHFSRPAYVITPASNGNNILDIYPAAAFTAPHFKDRELFVIGLAADYYEALDVAARIVNDMYQKTGCFELPAFLNADRKGQ